MGNSSSKEQHDPTAYASPFIPGSSSVVSESEWAQWTRYDYVIVGGGTAGCVLASRLSEDRGTTVLLLEAGESNEGKIFSCVPLAFERLLGSTHDWRYCTIPQKTLNERTVELPRGKILGGTSSINALIYQQTDLADYDAWEERGGTGWGSSTMSKYFKRVQNDGPQVSSDTDLAPVAQAFIKAAESFGIPHRKDLNDPERSVGTGAFCGSIDANHERSSTATSYLRQDVRDRPNLTIAVSAHVERVLFTSTADDGVRAVGVQLSTSRDGPKFAVSAEKEVLLCCGVFGSPQTLLLSGVGPAGRLEELGIPVVRDLPAVGQGLLDHFTPGSIVFRAKPGVTWDDILQSRAYGALAFLRWLMFGSGPMGALCGQVGIFTRSDDPRIMPGPQLPVADMTSSPSAPDLEYIMFPFAITDYGHSVPPRGNYGISVAPVLLKPISTGTVELQSSSVYDPPLIDLNFMADQSDVNLSIRAVRFLLHLVRASPLCDVLDLKNLATAPEHADHYWIGDADPEKVSDAEILAFIRKYGQSSTHPTSTVRMGQSETASAVDPQLRVHGVQGLRVIDASVFPDQVSGHPCVPVMALAERAADLIRGVV